MSCDSWDSNAEFDIVPRPISGDHLDPIGCYLGEDIEKYLTHPYASPLFGDFTGLPPLLVQAGEAEVLRDEITLFAHKATLAGVQVQHELFEDAVHVFQTFPFLEMTREAFLSCRNFVRHVLPLHQSHSPRVLDVRVEAELENETGNEQSKVVRGDGQEESAASDIPQEPEESPSRPTASTDDDGPSWEYAPDKVDVEVELHSGSDSETEEGSHEPHHPPIADKTQFPASPPLSQPPIRRALSSLSRLYPGSPPAHPPRTKKLSLHMPAGRPRNHSTTTMPHPLTLSVSLQPPSPHTPQAPPLSPTSRRTPAVSLTDEHAPPPSVRRMRTKSHPDITALCSQWATEGPANKTITYRA